MENMLLALLGGLFLVALITLVVAVVLYVLLAISLSKIAEREGVEPSWLAWIPVANLVLMAKLVEDDVHESIRGKFTMISIVAIVAGPILGQVIGILAYLPVITMLYSFYFIAKRYSKNETANIVVAAVTLGASVPIQLFRFRNREAIEKQAA
ncbi:hypothetical protein [Globicatella sulfidifaciens]|uniref:Uncharacterized protein n=1 Tax=Globicatella sulfidifaciens TaxID=136093 RepID=A0A7X8C5L4_9LACT|nr:hypothetical protein [Globicatella sulfidifaciens]NLJ19345.1 hypothetical protein [Globicatella sulfidifaciens]